MSTPILSNITLCSYRDTVFVRADYRSGNLYPSPVETFWFKRAFESASAAKAVLLTDKIHGEVSTKSSMQRLPTLREHALTNDEKAPLDKMLDGSVARTTLHQALAELEVAGCDAIDPLQTLLAENAVRCLRAGQESWSVPTDSALPAARSITQAGLPAPYLDILERNKDPRAALILEEPTPLGVSLAHRICARYIFDPADIQAAVRSLRALATAGYPMNGSDSRGRTPLLTAAASARPPAEIIYALVEEFGANLLAVDRNGRNALHLAAERGNAEALGHLIQLLNNQYRHADVRSILDAKDRWGNTPLMLACTSTNAEAIEPLLRARAVVTEANRDGNTALHLVAESRYKTDMVAALVKAGANLSAINANGQRPVDVAAAYTPPDGESGNAVHALLTQAMHNHNLTQPLRDARFVADESDPTVWKGLAASRGQQLHDYQARVSPEGEVTLTRETRGLSSEPPATEEVGRFSSPAQAVQAYLDDLAALNQQPHEDEPTSQSEAPRG